MDAQRCLSAGRAIGCRRTDEVFLADDLAGLQHSKIVNLLIQQFDISFILTLLWIEVSLVLLC